MAEVHRLSELRREYMADGERSAMRATWHKDSGYVVISLWRDDVCVATSHLTPKEAGRLATFVTEGLADMAGEAHLADVAAHEIAPSLTVRVNQAIARARGRVGRWLGSIANRLSE